MYEREAENWQEALRTIFPTVIVRFNDRVPHDPDLPIFDVFLIPDERLEEFMVFLLKGQVCELEEKYGLLEVCLMAHCTSATYEHYPHIVESKSVVSVA